MGTARHVPGTEAVTRRRDMIPAELFEALFWLVAGPIADPGEPGMRWRGLLLPARTVPRSGPGHPGEPDVLRLVRHRG